MPKVFKKKLGFIEHDFENASIQREIVAFLVITERFPFVFEEGNLSKFSLTNL